MCWKNTMISKKKPNIPRTNKSLNYIWNNVISLFEVWKNTKSKDPNVVKTKTGRIMLLSKCVVCDSKKMAFIKE